VFIAGYIIYCTRSVVWRDGVMIKASWVRLSAIPLPGSDLGQQVVHTRVNNRDSKQYNLIRFEGSDVLRPGR